MASDRLTSSSLTNVFIARVQVALGGIISANIIVERIHVLASDGDSHGTSRGDTPSAGSSTDVALSTIASSCLENMN